MKQGGATNPIQPLADSRVDKGENHAKKKASSHDTQVCDKNQEPEKEVTNCPMVVPMMKFGIPWGNMVGGVA